MEPLFMLSPQVGPGVEITDEVEADNIETDRANAYATLEVPDPGKAVAHCRVTRRYRYVIRQCRRRPPCAGLEGSLAPAMPWFDDSHPC